MIKRLGEIASFQRGLTYSKGDETVSSSKKVLRSNNIDSASSSLDLSEIKYLREDFVIPQDRKLKANTIFICMSNGSKQHVGKVAFIEKDMDFAFGGFMGLIIPSSEVSAKYVFYACQSSAYRTFLSQIGNGIGITNLRFSDLEKFEFPLPSFPEQQHIVAELDFLSGIIEKKNAQLKTLDELAQSIFYEMFGDPRENELNWKSKAFKDVFKLKSGDGLKEKDFIPGKYPVFGGNGISGYHNVYNKNGEHIIIGRVGAYCGNVRYVNNDFWLTDNAFDAFFNTSEFDYQFVSWLLNILDLHRFANHAAQPVISNTGLRELSIIIPSIDLQTDFANKISAIEHTKKLVTASLETTKQLLNSRMDKYFNV